MEINEVLHLIFGSGGLAGVLFLIFRTGRIVQKIDHLDKDLHTLKVDVNGIKNDVSDIKERVAFIESFVFFSEFRAESNNPRSEAAKRMWDRRKSKKLEVQK